MQLLAELKRNLLAGQWVSKQDGLQRRITHRLLSYWDISQNQFAVPYAFDLIKLKKSKKQKK